VDFDANLVLCISNMGCWISFDPQLTEANLSNPSADMVDDKFLVYGSVTVPFALPIKKGATIYVTPFITGKGVLSLFLDDSATSQLPSS